LFSFSLPLNLYSAPAQTPAEPAANYLFRDSYYAAPTVKLKYEIYEVDGLLLVRDSKQFWHSDFSVVTGFKGPMLESRTLKNIKTIDDARSFLEKNVRKIYFERIPIKELPLTQKDGKIVPRYWVGQRAFESIEQAKASVAGTKTAIEQDGGNFDRSLELVSQFFPEEQLAPTEAQNKAHFLEEEELALKMIDWLDIGTKLYGPVTGTALGERLLWQSFGETSFRNTNLSNTHFNAQVGYWTNRLVFKGIKFVGEPTIDPYLESTVALESNGLSYADHLDLIAGLEYRPFGRSAFLDNFNFEGLYLLKFARNYRFYVQYMERKNITDEIAGSQDTDVWTGLDIFYEWGIDLQRPWVEAKRTRMSDWVGDFVWGEYYGNYRFEKTDFSTNKHFNSWILNSSLILGVKFPTIDLPANPINDQFQLMPYLRFEQTANPNRTYLSYQNQMFMAAGIRWMPFRSFQFENNEWLFKTKVFGEFVGLGGVWHPGSSSAPDTPGYDWRVGVAFSYRRY
jgi:hypothetical protein